MFSVLTSMGRVEGESLLDLFAGSGALGIEGLSRGAARAVFVDSSPDALRVVRSNLAVLGPEAPPAEVVRSDALRYLAAAGWFDLVFADPPYGFALWPQTLALLRTRTGLLVAELGAGEESPFGVESGWETVKVRRYGGTVLMIARPGETVPAHGTGEGEN